MASLTTSLLSATAATRSPLASSTIIALTTSIIESSKNGTKHGRPGADPADTGRCHLLGPFALLVQAALGALALLSLVYKRWRERPQRPVKIWAFDVSKQVFGTVLLHMANLLMSMFSAGEIQAQIAKAAAATVGAGGDDTWSPNPCSFYILNLGIDTTLGIPILLLILKVLTYGASKTPLANPPESIHSGYYGDPPRATWWLKQSVLYFLGLLGMKTCVFFIFQLCPWIVVVGDWALRWTEGNQALQITFVMFVFPLIMNAFQYYVVDSFIKKKPDSDDGASQISQSGSEGERGGLLAGDEHHDHDRLVEEETDLHKGFSASTSTTSVETGSEDDDKPPTKSTKGHAGGRGDSSGSSTIAERDTVASDSRQSKPT